MDLLKLLIIRFKFAFHYVLFLASLWVLKVITLFELYECDHVQHPVGCLSLVFNVQVPPRGRTPQAETKVQCYEPATMKYLGYFPALTPDEVSHVMHVWIWGLVN